MPNPNQFASEAAAYSFDQAIKGQAQAIFYDPLKQVALQPSLRRNASGDIMSVLPYAKSSIWGLFSQLQGVLGSEKKTVRARKFFWTEYDQLPTFAFSVLKSGAGVPAGGQSVTVQVSPASLPAMQNFAKGLGGYKAMIKEANRQIVTLATTPTQLPNGNWQVTLTPQNGEVLNLTTRGQYTILLAGMRNYSLTNPSAKIQTEGLIYNPPALFESWVQKYESGFSVDESEIDNYVYDKDWFIMKGLNASGQEVRYFYIPSLSIAAEEKIIQNRTFRTLFNRRDYLNDQDFDGVIPTIENYGMFNYTYDIFMGASFKSLLFSMIKNLRKINGSNEYMLVHDFNFGLDWSEAIAQIVRSNNQSYKFSLFGEGGMGQQDFTYFEFKDFMWNNYKFRAYQMDAMDDYQYGHPLDYFAMLLPAKAYTDTDGNRVPIMNYVGLEGAEAAKEQKVWIDDGRERGERNLNVFIKDCFGIEIHKPTQLGMISRGKNTAS